MQDASISPCGCINEDSALKKAAAWYYVTYSKDEKVETYDVGNLSVRFLSFPWIMSDYLMKIYKKNLKNNMIEARPVSIEIGDSIMEHFGEIEGYLVDTFSGHCHLR